MDLATVEANINHVSQDLTCESPLMWFSRSRASWTSLVSSASRRACWARWVSSSSLTQAWQYCERKSRSYVQKWTGLQAREERKDKWLHQSQEEKATEFISALYSSFNERRTVNCIRHCASVCFLHIFAGIYLTFKTVVSFRRYVSV